MPVFSTQTRNAGVVAVPAQIRPQRIVVIDENELIQSGMQAILCGMPWVDNCFVADSPSLALQLIRRHKPQLVLISMTLPHGVSLSLCRQILHQLPHTKLILMSSDGHVSRATALSLGAVAALNRNVSRPMFITAVRKVAEGMRVFAKSSPETQNKLSPREIDVLHYISAGLSNPEIAEALNLSKHTVKQHTSSIYRKLNVRNRAEAASKAHELGLVNDPALSSRRTMLSA